MQQDIVKLLISIEADCRAQFTSSQLHLLPSHSISSYLFSAHLNTLNYSRCCRKNCLGTATQGEGVAQHQQPIHLPLTCHMPHGTRLCGTPININLSIKVIHYVALPHATRGNASSTCLATSSPALTWLPAQYLLFFVVFPHRRTIKYSSDGQ